MISFDFKICLTVMEMGAFLERPLARQTIPHSLAGAGTLRPIRRQCRVPPLENRREDR